MPPEPIVITLSCPDRPGVVRTVADFFYRHDCDIVESHQFGELSTRRFFMRVHLNRGAGTPPLPELRELFRAEADPLDMTWGIHDLAVRPRLLIMVSKFDHCLNDLLYRWRSGLLPAEVVAIVSNHPDLEPLAQWHRVPYHHVPVSPETKPAAEARLFELVDELGVDLVVLARYMQVLTVPACERLAGRAINIHHSFLPSFKGAAPYRQAYERGVKLIGATAHYVTADLDEGPIIEQDVARVDHQASLEDMVALGRDIEARTLSRAVTWHAQHRILLNGARTVVFT